MSTNHFENQHLGLAALSLSNRLRWVPTYVGRPMQGGASTLGFEPLGNITVATADGNRLVIGLQLLDSNNKCHNPNEAAGHSQLQHVTCEVFRVANGQRTNQNLYVTNGNTIGLIQVQLGHVGDFEIKVLGRTIKAKVLDTNAIITEAPPPPPEEPTAQ